MIRRVLADVLFIVTAVCCTLAIVGLIVGLVLYGAAVHDTMTAWHPAPSPAPNVSPVPWP